MVKRKVKTMPVRVPRTIVAEWRSKFPEVKDADLVATMWRTSILRMEAGLRPHASKKKKKDFPV